MDRRSSAPLRTPSLVWIEALSDMVLCRHKSYPGSCRHNPNPSSRFANSHPNPSGRGLQDIYNTRHKSLKQEPFVLNFLQISYIHSWHLCSHLNLPLSFPNVEPRVFWSSETTVIPKSTLGKGKITQVFQDLWRVLQSWPWKSPSSNWTPPFQPPSGHQGPPRSPPAQKYPVLRTIVPSASRRHVSVNLRALTPNWGEGHKDLQSFETRGEKPGDWLSLKAKWSKRSLKGEGMAWQTSRKSTKNRASIIHCFIAWPYGPILVLHLIYLYLYKWREVATPRCHGSNISGWQQSINVTQKVNSHCFKLHLS